MSRTMSNDQLESVAWSVVKLIIDRQYKRAVEVCAVSRLSAEDLEKVIREYGRTLIDPPEDIHKRLDSIACTNTDIPTWSVHVPLWTREEGLSDLFLELTISRDGNMWQVELDDLLVL